MKKLGAAAMAAMAVISLPLPAYSLTTSGNQFLEKCSIESDITEVVCTQYVLGVWDGFVAMVIRFHLLLKAGDVDMPASEVSAIVVASCWPDGVKFEQLRDTALSYVRDNPASRHKPAGILIQEAWAKAFPCKE